MKHSKKKPKVEVTKTEATHWANCFLEHAARETEWMRANAKECQYAAAHDASVRRGVWLTAALYAQERGK